MPSPSPAYATTMLGAGMGRIARHLVRVGVAVVAALGLVLLVTPAASAALPAYTALGDSFSSGVGTRSYYNDGTNCQRSSYAFPVLDAQRLGAALTFAACSGAKVADVLNNQLGSLSSGTRYVTVSVGGNDAGFSDVITQCALPWPYTCWSQINNAKSFIQNTLPGRLDNLYNAMRARATTARIVVVGYPRLFNGQECNLGSRISSSEQAELNATADLLRTVTSARAAAHGFGYANAIPPFVGHAICDSVEWINGLSSPISESYHPNRSGHASGYAPIVETALRA
jgi:lysophospholipase L1-like esterase